MPASPPASSPHTRASRPASPPLASPTWEDRLLDATMAPPSPRGPGPEKGGRKTGGPKKKDSKRLFSSSWKRASAIEGVAVGMILLFVVIARPSPEPTVAPHERVEAVASGVTSDGAVALASGARVRLLGVTLPTGEDAPVVQSAAFEMLDRLVRGRRIQIEFDPVLPSAAQEKQRTAVAYVWVLDGDGQRKAMVNVALLARGLARPVTAVGFGYQQEFLRAATLAKARGAGVWRAPEQPVGAFAPPF